MKILKYLFIGFIALMIIALFLPDVSKNSNNQEGETSLSGVQLNKKNWHYESNVDEMTGDTYNYASVESSNEISFDFPYKDSKGYLTIRTYQGDLEVILKMESGQIMPSVYDSEYAEFKFDDNPILKITYNESEQLTEPVIFFNKADAILRNIKKSKKLMLRVPFFDKGRETLYFDIEGLKIK